MTIVVLLVLALVWAAVLLPPVFEKRRFHQPSNSIGDFRHQLSVLQRTGVPHAQVSHVLAHDEPAHAHRAPVGSPMPARPMVRNDVVRRRRDVFLTLVASAGLTFLLALGFGGILWLFHLLVDAALLGYVAMLLDIQQRSAHRRPAAPARPVAQRPAPAMGSTRAEAALARTQAAYRASQLVPDNVVAMRRPSPTQQALLRRQAN